MFIIGQTVKVVGRSCRGGACLGRISGCIGMLGKIENNNLINRDGRYLKVRLLPNAFCTFKESEIVSLTGANEELE